MNERASNQEWKLSKPIHNNIYIYECCNKFIEKIVLTKDLNYYW